MDKDTLWICPRCGRQFENQNQAHSCESYLVEDRFSDKPSQVKEAFGYLVSEIEKSGPVYIDVVETAINLRSKSHFAAAQPQKSSFNLEFYYNRPIKSPRILKEQKLGDQYIYEVKVSKKEDVDNEILTWLRQAYFMKS